MFIEQKKPKDFDCGRNLDKMIAYAKRAVGLIKQSHPNWVDDNGKSEAAWEHFFNLAEYNPEDHGIYNPFKSGQDDDAQ